MLDNNNLLLCTSIGGGTDIIGPLLTAPSGRQYYRHSSGMGSVMIWNDGANRLA